MPLGDFTTPRRTISPTARQRLPPPQAPAMPSMRACTGLIKGSRLRTTVATGADPISGAGFGAAAWTGFGFIGDFCFGLTATGLDFANGFGVLFAAAFGAALGVTAIAGFVAVFVAAALFAVVAVFAAVVGFAAVFAVLAVVPVFAVDVLVVFLVTGCEGVVLPDGVCAQASEAAIRRIVIFMVAFIAITYFFTGAAPVVAGGGAALGAS